jgi:pimeloyl-ACP methyl ester carboxylesterase
MTDPALAPAVRANPTTSPSTPIRPFRVHFSETELLDLRSRIAATRWPERETVDDESQGVPLATMQELARYWATDYDFRKCEARLNALPQFVTEIEDLDIHFIHVRSPHADALPIVLSHGWPGSVLWHLKLVERLTNPTAHGGSAAEAFHVVIPSLPGYGFSGKPAVSGWHPARVAGAWTALMRRLGYPKFVAQGGDWGALVTEAMGKQAPPELLAIHVNLPGVVPADVLQALHSGSPPPAGLSSEEGAAFEKLAGFIAKSFAYAREMATRPQTLYGIADSPVGLAAWMLDLGDGDAQPAAAMTAALAKPTVDHPADELTRDDVLDNITLYWLTNTGVSSGRLYWENQLPFFLPMNITIPVAVSAFPGELFQAPRSWVERAFSRLIHYNEPERGGHFAPWEQPQIFTAELRAAFRSVRG